VLVARQEVKNNRKNFLGMVKCAILILTPYFSYLSCESQKSVAYSFYTRRVGVPEIEPLNIYEYYNSYMYLTTIKNDFEYDVIESLLRAYRIPCFRKYQNVVVPVELYNQADELLNSEVIDTDGISFS
jgi:hypothetical protein